MNERPATLAVQVYGYSEAAAKNMVLLAREQGTLNFTDEDLNMFVLSYMAENESYHIDRAFMA